MTRANRKIIPFPPRKPVHMVSAHADHNYTDYHFLRQHTGRAPEPMPRLRSWLEIGSIVGFAACMVVGIYLTCKL